MKNRLKIKILKSDFENSQYRDNSDCALARALKRKYSNVDIKVYGSCLNIDTNTYYIEDYLCVPETYHEPKDLLVSLIKYDEI